MELTEAIEQVESRYYRTASDIGANSNALFVQNAYRDLAGLSRLTLDDLREREIDDYRRSLADAFVAGDVEKALKYKGYIDSVRAAANG